MTTPPTRTPDPLRKLTPREAQALAHLAAGHDLDHTAAALGVTATTARSYLHRAMRKLGCPTEAAAIALLTTAPPTGPGRRSPATPTDTHRTRTAPTAPGERSGMTQTTPTTGDPGTSGDRHRSPSPSPSPLPSPGRPTADGASGAPTRPRPGPGDGPAAPPAAAGGPAKAPAEGRRGTGPARPAAERRGPQPTDRRQSTDGRRSRDTGGPGGPARGRSRDRTADGRSGTRPATPAGPPADGSAGRNRPDGRPAATPTGPGTAFGPGAAFGPGGRAERGRSGGGRPAPEPPAAGPEHRDAAPAPAPVERDTGGARERISLALTEAGHGRDLSENFEELYEDAHTRLVQQVFLLTACRHRAVHCVRRAFGEARQDWGGVVGSGDPEGWVRVRACELALSPWRRGGPRRAGAWALPHRRIRVRPADEAQSVLPDHDRLTDRDRALLKALRRLSRPQRRALVLHDGLGLPASAIAVEVESTRRAAEGRVWAAREALAQWVPELVGPDPAAPGFADGLSGLLHRAAVRGCPEPHRAPVPVLQARHRLWTASRTGAAALLTVAVGGAAVATLAGLRPAALFHEPDPPVPALCVPAPTAEVAEPGVPLLPGGAPNGISSLWCSPTPGLEAVVADPQAQAVARWELPVAARGAAPPPQQDPAACPAWSPLPCGTGPAH
ncbi:LuxR C-terminal-related transcriptional regulator [Kitasatospora sp. NPDC089797]|uniref:LuxR C-terminal-related transcriptional regulator n=1 Tax=Kitasatospora sp. NPDC089797 TaxID=3155298 RepID=UPI003444B1CB